MESSILPPLLHSHHLLFFVFIVVIVVHITPHSHTKSHTYMYHLSLSQHFAHPSHPNNASFLLITCTYFIIQRPNMSAPSAPTINKRASSSSNSSEEDSKSHHDILRSSQDDKTHHPISVDPNVSFSQVVERVDRLYAHEQVRYIHCCPSFFLSCIRNNNEEINETKRTISLRLVCISTLLLTVFRCLSCVVGGGERKRRGIVVV